MKNLNGSENFDSEDQLTDSTISSSPNLRISTFEETISRLVIIKNTHPQINKTVDDILEFASKLRFIPDLVKEEYTIWITGALNCLKCKTLRKLLDSSSPLSFFQFANITISETSKADQWIHEEFQYLLSRDPQMSKLLTAIEFLYSNPLFEDDLLEFLSKLNIAFRIIRVQNIHNSINRHAQKILKNYIESNGPETSTFPQTISHEELQLLQQSEAWRPHARIVFFEKIPEYHFVDLKSSRIVRSIICNGPNQEAFKISYGVASNRIQSTISPFEIRLKDDYE